MELSILAKLILMIIALLLLFMLIGGVDLLAPIRGLI